MIAKIHGCYRAGERDFLLRCRVARSDNQAPWQFSNLFIAANSSHWHVLQKAAIEDARLTSI